MDNKQFDKNIKQKLSDLEGNAPPPDWDDFSKLLSSESEFKDLSFDQVFSNALKDKKQRFNSLHWVQLKKRLQTEAKLRKEVYSTKIFEFILIILLSFTFVNLDRHYNLVKEEQDPIAEAVQDALKYPDFSGLIPMGKSKKVESLYKPVALLKERDSNKGLATSVVENDNDSQELSIQFIPHSIIKLTSNGKKIGENKSMFDALVSEDVLDKEEHNSRHVEDIERLGSINTKINNLQNAYPEFYYPLKDEEAHAHFLTMGVSSNFNIIRSPEDPIFGVDAYNVYDPSFSFGVGIGTLHGNYELSTGFTFERMQYSPLRITEFTSTDNGLIDKSSLERIKFDIVSVPVNLRYHFNPKKKTHFWMGIGVAMNMAIGSDYSIERSTIQRVPSSYDRSIVNLSNRAEETYLNKKNFHDGFLESGHFFDNFYLSSYAEIGISKQINNHVRYNASIGYATTFTNNGIGPNYDTFDAFRLGLTLAYSL